MLYLMLENRSLPPSGHKHADQYCLVGWSCYRVILISSLGTHLLYLQLQSCNMGILGEISSLTVHPEWLGWPYQKVFSSKIELSLIRYNSLWEIPLLEHRTFLMHEWKVFWLSYLDDSSLIIQGPVLIRILVAWLASINFDICIQHPFRPTNVR